MHLRSSFRSAACSTGHVPEVGGGGGEYIPADALVAKLRSQSATCPIALLTGKAGSKDVDETELVAAIEQHGLMFLQKPVTASIAASQFNVAFANR